MAVENWNTNDALNGTIEGENIAEGSLPADVNDVLRKICAQVRVFFNKSYRMNETVLSQATGGSLPAVGGLVENTIVIEYIP